MKRSREQALKLYHPARDPSSFSVSRMAICGCQAEVGTFEANFDCYRWVVEGRGWSGGGLKSAVEIKRAATERGVERVKRRLLIRLIVLTNQTLRTRISFSLFPLSFVPLRPSRSSTNYHDFHGPRLTGEVGTRATIRTEGAGVRGG